MKTILLVLCLFFSAKAIGETTVAMTGPIGDYKVLSALESLYNQRDKIKDKKITLLLNSPGGYVDLASRIANIFLVLKSQGFEITTVNVKECSSACFLIWAVGNKRLVLKESTSTVHQAFKFVDGKKINEQRATLDMTIAECHLFFGDNVIQRNICIINLNKLKLDNTVLNAQELLKLEFATGTRD